MDVLIEFTKILLPAALVLYAMYLGVRTMIGRELSQQQLDVRQKSIEITLPVRMQAYERICLFLERITPSNLIVRVNDPALSAPAFQQLLLQEIRDEYNHNVSQQVYMSTEVWEMVKTAKEDLILDINTAAEGLNEESGSVDLAKRIFEHLMNKNIDPIDHALKSVKAEIARSF
jgi:hypothetical protein